MKAMECKQAIILIRTALDAGRTAEPPAHVRVHLEGCQRCRRLWAEEAAIEAGLRELGRDEEPEAPAALHAGIMHALARRPLLPKVARSPWTPGRFRRKWLTRRLGLGVAAALMLALAAGWPLLDRAPREPVADGFLFPVTIEGVFSALDPAPLLEAPRQDFQALASSILSATNEWLPVAGSRLPD